MAASAEVIAIVPRLSHMLFCSHQWGYGFILPPIILDPESVFFEEPDFPAVNTVNPGGIFYPVIHFFGTPFAWFSIFNDIPPAG